MKCGIPRPGMASSCRISTAALVDEMFHVVSEGMLKWKV